MFTNPSECFRKMHYFANEYWLIDIFSKSKTKLSTGLGDLAQMARLVRIHAAGGGQLGGHHIEGLDRHDWIEVGGGSGRQGQVAVGDIGWCRQQYLGTALAHFGCQLQHTCLRRSAGGKHE